MPMHHHEVTCLAAVLSGEIQGQTGALAFRARPSSILCVPAGERHAHRFEGHVHTLDVVFTGRMSARIGGSSLLRAGHFEATGGVVTGTLTGLLHELRTPDVASALMVEGLGFQLIAALTRSALATTTQRPPVWLRRVRERLRETYRSGPTLSSMAADVEVHPAHLAREFHRYFGCSLGADVRRLRVDYAARRIVSSGTPLAEIAVDAGFSDQSHFTRVFRTITGTTPERYRRAHATSSPRTQRPA
jgi:AraC family transcriptional regulator